MEQIDGLERKVREMQGMIDTLRDLADACRGDHRPDCPILADLEHGVEHGRDNGNDHKRPVGKMRESVVQQ